MSSRSTGAAGRKTSSSSIWRMNAWASSSSSEGASGVPESLVSATAPIVAGSELIVKSLQSLVLSSIMVSMNRLSTERRGQVIALLVEGMSIRGIVRATGVAKNTIVKLLCDLGEACSEYQDVTLRNLDCPVVECDEIWSFCYSKQKNVPEEHRGTFGYGDVWTWTAIDADTKLVPCWHVGTRDGDAAFAFMTDLADRLSNRVQLTTDGHHSYLSAVDAA